jgi:large subunit ribosomal protein L46
VTANASTPEYVTHSGILLSRPPLVTNAPTAFEKAFYFYQKRLNERLVMPFTRYFYFKKDTPALADWKIKAAERDWQPARELGGYNAHREDAWNDELLVGDKLSETSSLVDALVNDATPRAVVGKDGKPVEATEEEIVKVEKPLGRITEADRTNDQKRLDRKLNRTLYLCVKREKGGWGFPAGALEGRENLDQVCACFTRFSTFLVKVCIVLIWRIQAAERVLVQTAGMNMNTWIIGHAPAGYHINQPFYVDSKLSRPGVRTFFMRARIMAGQANIKENLFGINDFKWLTKQEVEEHVSARYFSWVKNMMHDR